MNIVILQNAKENQHRIIDNYTTNMSALRVSQGIQALGMNVLDWNGSLNEEAFKLVMSSEDMKALVKADYEKAEALKEQADKNLDTAILIQKKLSNYHRAGVDQQVIASVVNSGNTLVEVFAKPKQKKEEPWYSSIEAALIQWGIDKATGVK